ncbi:MAG: hypothetical protein ACRENB_05825 [Gemmatimonadales bacterium]
MRARTLPLAAVLACWAGPAPAQLIPIRTVPISQAHQFDFFPSDRMAMGGVTLAVHDSLYDPFGNPAKGLRLGTSRFFGSPGVYSVTSGAGAGRTLPLGTWLRSGAWFGGASVALQEIDLSDNAPRFLPPPCLACERLETIPLPAENRSPGNTFGYAMLGRTLTGTGLSVGGSVFWSGLHGIDGTDLLYPGSVRLRQRGHALDLRAGALQEWRDGRTLSAVLVHNRYAASHEVYYLDTFWDPGGQSFSQRTRQEDNLDHTNTWGAHVEFSHPLPGPGWRLGWVATTNLMSHPKIPNYEIQSIPRDPGNSEAFNLGLGISRSTPTHTFALDLIFEPIWSYTWADAAEPVEGAAGTIPAGGKTIENRFRFSNALFRMGFSQEIPLTGTMKSLGLRFGLGLHRIDYSLVQDDNVQGTTRRLDESWVEWTPTWGLSFRFPSWEIRYRGSVTQGTGRPGVQSGDIIAVAEADRNILVAPSGPLTLTGVTVMTHQVAFTFPFR